MGPFPATIENQNAFQRVFGTADGLRCYCRETARVGATQSTWQLHLPLFGGDDVWVQFDYRVAGTHWTASTTT